MVVVYYIIVTLCVVMFAYTAYTTFRCMIERHIREEEEDQAYYRAKKMRQERIEQHEQALIKRCLVDTWAHEFPNTRK